MRPRPLLMTELNARPRAVLLPPPSHPDDGPSALEVPPLGLPPASLKPAPPATNGPLPVRAWIVMVALFLLGTALSYYFQN
jgi:hypothetical protein